MAFPKQDHASMCAYYGNPDPKNNGQPSLFWEARNLVKIKPPYPMVWSWNQQPVKSIRLHRLCAPAFEAALRDVATAYTATERKKYQLDQCGGGYNFRLMRGVNALSIHSWGAALDLAPELNWLGRMYDPRLNMMPRGVVDIFAKHGLQWGGKWSRPDAMHFQATK